MNISKKQLEDIGFTFNEDKSYATLIMPNSGVVVNLNKTLLMGHLTLNDLIYLIDRSCEKEIDDSVVQHDMGEWL